MADVDGLVQVLRGLSSFPSELPGFDPGAALETPTSQFATWLDDAVAAGILAPHAATLSTADSDGRVSGRTLVLRGIEDDGWVFSSHGESGKGRDIEANPNAALTFFWATLGRQVRVAGPVRTLDAERAALDFLGRPESGRASSLVGHQSEPLDSKDTYTRAEAEALEAVRADPRIVAGDWRCYAIVADTVEFWQASADRAHVRLRYTRESPSSWTRQLLWP